MIATACVALAAALVCAPGPQAVTRLTGLWPAAPAPRTWRPGAAWPIALGGLGGLLVAGPGGAFAGVLVAFTARRRLVSRRAEMASVAAARQLADAVGRVGEELRTGSHPAAALGGVTADGPYAREILAPAAVAARLGDGVPAALCRAAHGRTDIGADLHRMAAAWTLAERHGIPLAELLAGVQRDIHWREQFGNTVRAQLAGPRATAAVLAALPALGIGLGQLVGADPLAVLRAGVLGQALLVLGVALAAAGTAWTEHILRAAVPR